MTDGDDQYVSHINENVGKATASKLSYRQEHISMG